MKIVDTRLSVRAKNILRRNGIETDQQLLDRYRAGKLHRIKFLGPVTANEIKKWLEGKTIQTT